MYSFYARYSRMRVMFLLYVRVYARCVRILCISVHYICRLSVYVMCVCCVMYVCKYVCMLCVLCTLRMYVCV